jgi:type IV secretory pathway VirB10-like protein
LAEQAATQFLVHPQVWAVQTPEQRQRTVHLLSDLISLTAQRLAEADTAEQGDLRHMVEQTAKAIVVAADSTGASSISAAASPLTSLERQADPQQVLQLVQGIHPAVVEVPAYAQTPPPPQVAAAPSTQQAEPEDEAADDDAADADDAGEAEMGTDDADDAAADDDAADDDTAEQPGDAADNTDVAAPDADAPTAEPADAPAPEAPATP